MLAFQKAFHAMLCEYIVNSGSLDFARISREIHNDVVRPRLLTLERRYKNAATLYKRTAVAQVGVAAVPVSVAIVARQLFGDEVLPLMTPIMSASLAATMAALAYNKLELKKAASVLQDDDFYVIWKLARKYKIDY